MHLPASDSSNEKTSRVLRVSLAVTLVYIILLVIAGFRSHSLALLSEAGHNLTDFVALLMSWGAVYLQGRPPSARRTYGYNRAGVLAAFINGLTLVLQGGYSDANGSYAPGDLQVADSEILHNPIADPGEDCINLSVTTGPLRFKGLVPTIAGKLFGF